MTPTPSWIRKGARVHRGGKPELVFKIVDVEPTEDGQLIHMEHEDDPTIKLKRFESALAVRWVEAAPRSEERSV